MTVVTDEPPLATQRERSPWRRRITIAAVVIACLLLVAAVAVLGWRWRHPTFFFPAGSNSSIEGVTTQPGVVNWIGMTYPNISRTPVILHIDDVEPRVASDTAGARISFFICTNIQPPGPDELALGTARGDVSKYCSHLVPASNVDMPTGRGHYQNIVMRVVATQPGKLRVNGIDVSYRDGWQHGTQWTGFGVTVTAR